MHFLAIAAAGPAASDARLLDVLAAAAAYFLARALDIAFLFILIALFATAAVGSASASGRYLSLFFGIHAREAARPLAVAMSRLAVGVGLATVHLRFIEVAELLLASGLPMMVRCRLMKERRVFVVRGEAALASCLGGFLRIPLMRVAGLVRGASALARDFPLHLRIH